MKTALEDPVVAVNECMNYIGRDEEEHDGTST
ncbi:hypothetical protein SAMN05444972_11094 [Marininema halotolerans]|uniref:Uncharacterized protein n=1 Tax=Marininema halotolerans TaxID=1155944 RepID=A0A1I6TLJ2_9BACL|nr:hypothetical protein SAMN05444972_11094 [Marininema halotolerans]